MSPEQSITLPLTAVLLALTMPADGCSLRRITPVTPPNKTADHPKGRLSAQTVTLGRSVQDRPIQAQVFGNGADVTLMIATIHGNESAGTPLLRRLASHLESNPRLLHNRRAVLIPIANPDGFHAKTRTNANRVDVNRNFPAVNRKKSKRYGQSPLSEPEARAIARALRRFRPKRIISIHQPAACIDYDGPAADASAIL